MGRLLKKCHFRDTIFSDNFDKSLPIAGTRLENRKIVDMELIHSNSGTQLICGNFESKSKNSQALSEPIVDKRR